MAKQDAHIEVDPKYIHGSVEHEPSFFTADVSMVLMTWVTFFLLLSILYKYAWKPILSALDSREKQISDAVENAEKLQKEMESLEETRREILSKANTQSKQIIDEARKAANDAAKVIQAKTKEEAQIILENARRDVNEEFKKAQADLKQESANIAVELARKILETNMDEKKNSKLIDDFIKESS